MGQQRARTSGDTSPDWAFPASLSGGAAAARARPLRPRWSLARCRPRSEQMHSNRCRPGRAAAASGLMPGGMQQY
eukprot:8650840-Alexandrium_andersonii.AAC.1